MRLALSPPYLKKAQIRLAKLSEQILAVASDVEDIHV